MRVLLAPSSERAGSWSLQETDDAGAAIGAPTSTGDLAGTVSRHEAGGPRWVWASTAAVYPLLLRAGLRVSRCHDVGMTELLLRGHEERPAPAGGLEGDGGFVGGSTGGAQTSLFDQE